MLPMLVLPPQLAMLAVAMAVKDFRPQDHLTIQTTLAYRFPTQEVQICHLALLLLRQEVVGRLVMAVVAGRPVVVGRPAVVGLPLGPTEGCRMIGGLSL